MIELVEQIYGYARGLWRQRWYSLLIAWTVCLGGWLVVLNVPDKYPAETRVFVDTQTILKPLLRDLVVPDDPIGQISVMTKTLLSRPNLRKVARMTDLDLRAETARELERLLDDMEGNIEIRSSGTNLFTITYTDFDPEQAKSVVQALLTLFVESTIGETREETESAERFLLRQIEDTEQKLREAEKRLAQFKRQHIGTMPSDGRTYYQRLQAMRSQLESAKLALEQSRELRDEYERQLGGEAPSFAVFTTVDVEPGIEPVTEQSPSARGAVMGPTSSAALQSQIEGLLLQYTPNHPNVIAARRKLAELRAQELRQQKSQEAALEAQQAALADERAAARAEREAARANRPQERPVEANPVYQATRLAYNDAQAQVKAREVKVADYTKKVEELERLLSVVPAIEADLADMNRDYAVTSRLYQALLSKLQSARMSQRADQNADNVKFRVIDPPRVPHTPAGIDRGVLLTMVLALGFIVALGFALFLSQIFLTFDSRKQLMRVTRIPVFGTVSLVMSPRDQLKRWAGLLLFLVLVAFLLAVYVMVLQSEVGVNNVVS